MFKQTYVTIVELATINLPPKSPNSPPRVYRKWIRRACGMAVDTLAEGVTLARECFCQMQNDRIISGKLIGEVSTVEGDDVKTLELDLDQWAKDRPDEVLLLQNGLGL